jgi:hypothetical protein
MQTQSQGSAANVHMTRSELNAAWEKLPALFKFDWFQLRDRQKAFTLVIYKQVLEDQKAFFLSGYEQLAKTHPENACALLRFAGIAEPGRRGRGQPRKQRLIHPDDPRVAKLIADRAADRQAQAPVENTPQALALRLREYADHDPRLSAELRALAAAVECGNATEAGRHAFAVIARASNPSL